MKFEPRLKEIAVAKIIGPGDLKQRLRTQDAIDLAASCKKLGGGPMHPLLVRKGRKGWEIIAGRNRYAAATINKARTLPCRIVVQATELELLELEIEENLRRREDNRDALVADMVRRAVALMPAGRDLPVELTGNLPRQSNDSAQNGRPRSVEGAAREVVAKAMHTTPEAVRSAVKREEAKAEARQTVVPGVAPAPLPTVPIETFGHAVPAMTQVRVMFALDALGAMDKASRAAQKALSELEQGLMAGERPGWLQRMRDLAHQLGAEARALRPAYLCPKCIDAKYDVDAGVCKLCRDEGTITQEQYDALPPEQKSGGSVHAAGLDAAPDRAAALGDVDKALAEAEASLNAAIAAHGDRSDEYHVALAALHALSGVCGCWSCGFVKRRTGTVTTKAPARTKPTKAKRGMSVILPGATEAVPLDDAVRELSVERDDAAPWEE